jgi:hypothetical protein
VDLPANAILACFWIENCHVTNTHQSQTTTSPLILSTLIYKRQWTQYWSHVDIVLRYLSPEIEVARIALAENWRRGLKVVFRQ